MSFKTNISIHFIANQSHWTLRIISVLCSSVVNLAKQDKFGSEQFTPNSLDFSFTLCTWLSNLKLLKLPKSPWKEILERNHLTTLQNFGKQVKPVLSRHHWDDIFCPLKWGVLSSGVETNYNRIFGTLVSVLYIIDILCSEVSFTVAGAVINIHALLFCHWKIEVSIVKLLPYILIPIKEQQTMNISGFVLLFGTQM